MYVENTRDFQTLRNKLNNKELLLIDTVLSSYVHGKIDMDLHENEDGSVDFENIDLLVKDSSYKKNGFELLILKWYESYEDTGYLIECLKGTLNAQ